MSNTGITDGKQLTAGNTAANSTQQAFDHQSTGLVDVTFAETLGLSMHNAVNAQLNAQMAASSSVTSACTRILSSEPAADRPETAPIEASYKRDEPASARRSLFSRLFGNS